MSMQLSRRGFLKTTGATALVVGMGTNGALAVAAKSDGATFNPFVQVDGNGVVTVLIKHFEMGQGTTTGLATLVAEELDADWETLRTDYAPADNGKYKNLFFGIQGTGGSTAMANSFMQYRQAGAAARDMLVRAAAAKWGVSENSISIERGVLKSGNKSASFGDFVADAAKLEPKAEPKLKTPNQFRLIGDVSLPRKDSHDKTDGTGKFAMDVKAPGMLVAVVMRSPKFGGTVKSLDASAASGVSGFVDAKILPTKSGVVVYGKNTWAAMDARNKIKVDWDLSNAESRNTDELVVEHRKQVDKAQYQASKDMSASEAGRKVDAADQVVEAEFVFPFLAHAPMEPLVCLIEPTENGILMTDGSQFPGAVHGALAQVLGLQPDQVKIKTVYAGGSFGRRATPVADYQMEAAMAFAMQGGKVPVKLVWSREDDLHGGFYRPMAVHKARIGLGKDGKIAAWDHRIAAKSIMKGTAFEPMTVHNGVDHSSVEGVPDTLYRIPEFGVGLTDVESPITVLWWRSVGHSHTAYAMESLMDMVAEKSGQDPVALRLSKLDKSDAKQARMANVIETLRDASGWKAGQKRGFAAHFSFNSYVAVVADVTANGNDVHVDKLHIAIDCGVAVNPDVIKAQMEGGAGYGLGAIMRNEITFDAGEVEQANFPDYEPIRMADMPKIEVTIIKSAEAPSGVGEPAVPPTGPAVANAIYAQTGIRITDLPMTKAGISFV